MAEGGGDQRHPAVFTVSWLRVLMSYLANYELMGEKKEVEELGCGGGGWLGVFWVPTVIKSNGIQS